PPPPPPNPEPQPGSSMSKLILSAAVLAAAGSSDPITVERRLLSALAFERDVLRETGQAQADGALGVVRAWKRDAAELPGVQQQLVAASAVAEAAERVKVLEEATRGQRPKLLEAEAFAWEAVADPSKPDGLARGEDGKALKRRVVAAAYG